MTVVEVAPAARDAVALAKKAEALGWRTRLDRGVIDVADRFYGNGNLAKAAHRCASVVVRLARGDERGWAAWHREDDGAWSFQLAYVGLEKLPLRAGTSGRMTIVDRLDPARPHPPIVRDEPQPRRVEVPRRARVRPRGALTVWDELHTGDTVRGADGGVWTVTGRSPLPAWVLAGESARFRLTGVNDREVTTDRPLDEPAPLVERADHTPERDAIGALIGAGIAVTLIEETTVSDATEMLQGTPDHPSGERMEPSLNAVRQLMSPAVSTEPKRDRWGRYLLPDPVTGVERPWTRATTIARTLADEYHLTLWKLRMVAKGLALRPDLIAGAAAADPDEDKSTLNSIAEQAMQRAGAGAGANMGTALHTFTARLDRGDSLPMAEVPVPLDADLVAYQGALRVHGLRTAPGLTERIVVCPELAVAGTFDRVVSQPAGASKAAPFAILDLKTGKSVDLAMLEIAIQLAIYAHSPHMWNQETGLYEDMPAVDLDRALVLHLPVGKAKAQLYAVDIARGWRAALLAMQVRDARAGTKQLSWLVEPAPADLLMHNVSRADQRELARLWERHHPRGEWTAEVHAVATARLAVLTSPITATV